MFDEVKYQNLNQKLEQIICLKIAKNLLRNNTLQICGQIIKVVYEILLYKQSRQFSFL